MYTFVQKAKGRGIFCIICSVVQVLGFLWHMHESNKRFNGCEFFFLAFVFQQIVADFFQNIDGIINFNLLQMIVGRVGQTKTFLWHLNGSDRSKCMSLI